MILNNHSNGPRYSTDPIAADVSRFVARRATLEPTELRPKAPENRYEFEELYPSLYGRSSAPVRHALSKTLLAIGQRMARFLSLRKVLRYLVPSFVLASIIVAKPASASMPVYGDGVGYSWNANIARSIALTEADAAMGGACFGGVLGRHIVFSDIVWNGDTFVATVRVEGLCV